MGELILEGRRVVVRSRGSGGPVVVFPTASFGRDPVEGLAAKLESSLGDDAPYTLLALVSESWDDDYSPWFMEAGERRFGGHGEDTLKWITGVLLPYAEENLPNHGPLYVAGYSLAGLFALWAFYETGVFKGVACCSGSLWFEGWDEYIRSHGCPQGSRVYLSLGGKEPGSGPAPMNTIGDCYRRQKDILSRISGVDLRFEMNPGGHFSDPDGRVAKGIQFMLG